jgi:hypothetical protein
VLVSSAIFAFIPSFHFDRVDWVDRCRDLPGKVIHKAIPRIFTALFSLLDIR